VRGLRRRGGGSRGPNWGLVAAGVARDFEDVRRDVHDVYIVICRRTAPGTGREAVPLGAHAGPRRSFVAQIEFLGR